MAWVCCTQNHQCHNASERPLNEALGLGSVGLGLPCYAAVARPASRSSPVRSRGGGQKAAFVPPTRRGESASTKQGASGDAATAPPPPPLPPAQLVGDAAAADSSQLGIGGLNVGTPAEATGGRKSDWVDECSLGRCAGHWTRWGLPLAAGGRVSLETDSSVLCGELRLHAVRTSVWQ